MWTKSIRIGFWPSLKRSNLSTNIKTTRRNSWSKVGFRLQNSANLRSRKKPPPPKICWSLRKCVRGRIVSESWSLPCCPTERSSPLIKWRSSNSHIKNSTNPRRETLFYIRNSKRPKKTMTRLKPCSKFTWNPSTRRPSRSHVRPRLNRTNWITRSKSRISLPASTRSSTTTTPNSPRSNFWCRLIRTFYYPNKGKNNDFVHL